MALRRRSKGGSKDEKDRKDKKDAGDESGLR